MAETEETLPRATVQKIIKGGSSTLFPVPVPVPVGLAPGQEVYLSTCLCLNSILARDVDSSPSILNQSKILPVNRNPQRRIQRPINKRLLLRKRNSRSSRSSLSSYVDILVPGSCLCASGLASEKVLNFSLSCSCCEGITEFIRILSDTANEKCEEDKKKTIAPEHIMAALKVN